jgi:predicted RNase H-like HicB family nuclease
MVDFSPIFQTEKTLMQARIEGCRGLRLVDSLLGAWDDGSMADPRPATASRETTQPGEGRIGETRVGGPVANSYTARYAKIDAGYMGQLLEWPEVVTEGATIEECRAMLRDALHEMVLAYRQQGKEVPVVNDLFEQVAVDLVPPCC